MTTSLKFRDDPRWIPARDAVRVSVVKGDQEIGFLVSQEALEDLAGTRIAKGDDAIAIYRKHSATIQRVASLLIEAERLEEDGHIVVKSRDLGN